MVLTVVVNAQTSRIGSSSIKAVVVVLTVVVNAQKSSSGVRE